MNRLTLRCSNHFTYRYLIKCRRIWLPKLLPVRKVSGYTKLIHFQPYPAKEKELIRWLNFLRKEKINIVWRQISPLTERILDLVTPPPPPNSLCCIFRCHHRHKRSLTWLHGWSRVQKTGSVRVLFNSIGRRLIYRCQVMISVVNQTVHSRFFPSPLSQNRKKKH